MSNNTPVRSRAFGRPLQRTVPARLAAAVSLAAVSLVCGSAWGHVSFRNPEPGAVLVAGSTVELRWEDTIKHETIAYQLEFRPGGEAEAVEIASDLDPTVHTLEWEVPAELCTDCSLFLVQDNGGSDYTSSLPISIVAEGTDVPDGGNSDAVETGMHLPEAGAPALEGAGAPPLEEGGQPAIAQGGQPAIAQGGQPQLEQTEQPATVTDDAAKTDDGACALMVPGQAPGGGTPGLGAIALGLALAFRRRTN